MGTESILLMVGALLVCFLLGVPAGIFLQRRQHAKARQKSFEQDMMLTEKRVELLRETAKLLTTIDDFYYAARIKDEIEDLTKDQHKPERGKP